MKNKNWFNDKIHVNKALITIIYTSEISATR